MKSDKLTRRQYFALSSIAVLSPALRLLPREDTAIAGSASRERVRSKFSRMIKSFPAPFILVKCTRAPPFCASDSIIWMTHSL